MMKYVLAVLLCVVLTACGGNPVKEVAYKTQTTVITVPEEMYVPVQVPAPPRRDEYVALSSDDKENALTNYSAQLMLAIQLANEKLTLIGKRIQQALKDVEEKDNGGK